MRSDDEEFLKEIKQTFEVPVESNEELFLKAFTHRSFANENNLDLDNERLEFLGDTVLDLLVAEHLFTTYPDHREGRLSKIKSAVVRADSLSRMARDLGIPDFIRLSKGESQVQRGRDKVLADSLEAFIGAIYQSSGLDAVRDYIIPYVEDEVERYFKEGGSNYKGQLLEFAQDRGLPNPIYRVMTVEGPEHDPVHRIQVEIAGTVYGTGEGSTKKEAEQNAAQEALDAVLPGIDGEE